MTSFHESVPATGMYFRLNGRILAEYLNKIMIIIKLPHTAMAVEVFYGCRMNKRLMVCRLTWYSTFCGAQYH